MLCLNICSVKNVSWTFMLFLISAFPTHYTRLSSYDNFIFIFSLHPLFFCLNICSVKNVSWTFMLFLISAFPTHYTCLSSCDRFYFYLLSSSTYSFFAETRSAVRKDCVVSLWCYFSCFRDRSGKFVQLSSWSKVSLLLDYFFVAWAGSVLYIFMIVLSPS